MKRWKQYGNPVTFVTEPQVVILDLEKDVHVVKLLLSVWEAILWQWDETTAAREWKRE